MSQHLSIQDTPELTTFLDFDINAYRATVLARTFIGDRIGIGCHNRLFDSFPQSTLSPPGPQKISDAWSPGLVPGFSSYASLPEMDAI
jgi:hypothetical protein